MSTTYHADVATGAAANAATINAPLAALDAELVNIHAQTDPALTSVGVLKSNTVAAANVVARTLTFAKQDVTELLKQWTRSRAFRFTGTITYSTTYPELVSTATGTWPDGSAGTYTATTINATWRAVDAFTITHTDAAKTVTQSAVTRDTQGRVTTLPALTVT